MGRDIAGEREMRRTHGRRVSGLEALVVEGEQRRLLLLRPSKGLDPVRQLPSSSDAHGGLEKFGRQRQQQQDRPLPGLLMKQISLFALDTRISS